MPTDAVAATHESLDPLSRTSRPLPFPCVHHQPPRHVHGHAAAAAAVVSWSTANWRTTPRYMLYTPGWVGVRVAGWVGGWVGWVGGWWCVGGWLAGWHARQLCPRSAARAPGPKAEVREQSQPPKIGCAGCAPGGDEQACFAVQTGCGAGAAQTSALASMSLAADSVVERSREEALASPGGTRPHPAAASAAHYWWGNPSHGRRSRA